MHYSIYEQMRAELAQQRIFLDARRYATDYMAHIAGRDVFPTLQALHELEAFDEPLPQHPQAGEDVLRMLHAFGSPATVGHTSGRYFGFVNGGIIPAAVAARWLADIWDQNGALYVMSPVAARLEEICQGWLVDLLGLPPGTVAGLVGGSAMATFCGLAAARQAILKRQGWDVNEKGLFDAPRLRVVIGEQAHSTVFRALALLGLGREAVEMVPADVQGRINATALPALDETTLLILQAGNVNSSAFDPFAELCSRARSGGAWVHVDGAFGLWAAASAKKRHLTDGMDLADSWSADGHKTLNTPYDCGIVLCRHEEALRAAMQISGPYLQTSDDRDGMAYVPDMSRRARSVELWAALKFLGRGGVAQLVEGLCRRAEQFAAELVEAGFNVLNEVVFNQVLVAGATPAETRATLANVQRSGVCWCGGTSWAGSPAIRISVCSWATTAEDVSASVAAFVRARELATGS